MISFNVVTAVRYTEQRRTGIENASCAAVMASDWISVDFQCPDGGEMTSYRRVFAGALIAVSMAILIAIFIHITSQTISGVSVDPSSLRLAQNLVLEDQESSLEDGDAVTPKQTAMKNLGIAIAADARQLSADFWANEVAADQKYKVGKLLVSGTVSGISKDFANTPYVSLVGDQLFHDVQARFGEADTNTLASLKKGQKVYFVCDVRELVVTEVMLGNCMTVENYTMRTRQSSDQYVQNVLAGRQKIDKPMATAIATFYALVPLLPKQSTCFHQVDQACEVEAQKFFQNADKGERQELDKKASAIVAKMYVR